MADLTAASGSSATLSKEFETAYTNMAAKAQESITFQQKIADLNRETQAKESEIGYQVARDNKIAELISTISRG